jgi:hypothetical protein
MTRPMSVRPHLLSTPPSQAEFVLAHETDGDGRLRGSNRLLEAGFGPVDDPRQPKFADLDMAQDWIMQRLAGNPVRG